MRYSVIYCDPPWPHKDRRLIRKDGGKTRQGAGAGNHYPLMSHADIQALPVREIAEPDAVLFMWAVFPMLKEALKTIDAWGFTYRTCGFSWLKLNPVAGNPFKGIGFYTKSNGEVCLLATRGNTLKPATDCIGMALITPRFPTPRFAHSHKPSCVKMAIEMMYPDCARLEMFAREETAGWDVFGNQVENSVELPLTLPLDWGKAS